MRFRTVVLAASLALLAIPASADAAFVQLNRTCYLEDTGIVGVSGLGFAPNSQVVIRQDGVQVNTVQSDANGSFTIAIDAPKLSDTATRQRKLSVSATDGQTEASAEANVTIFGGDFSPAQGNPKTLKARFLLDGWNLVDGAPKTVYVHYVKPNGKLKKTIKLGKTKGPCGQLDTMKRKLFPFSAERGTWTLQWDYRKGFTTRCETESKFLCYAREVRIFKVT